MNDIFAKRLKERRKALGLSAAEVSRRVGLHVSSFSSWERGKSIPTVESLQKAAETLEVSTSWLLGETNNEDYKTKKVSPVNRSKYLHKAPNGRLFCSAKECEWRVHGTCPGAGCMKERAKSDE